MLIRPPSRLFAPLVVLVALLGPLPVAAQEASLPADREALEALIRDYLLAHPEVIIESVRRYQERQERDSAALVRETIRARYDEIFNHPDDPVAGNPEGDVTLVEFFDYNCPYCKRVAGVVAQAIAEDRGLRVVYKEFPILSASSGVAARAALAARKQDAGKYEPFHQALMANRGQLDEARIMALAEDLGLDRDRLFADMYGDDIGATLERVRSLARDLGVRGTPAFVIGERLIPGSVDLETLKRLIDEARSS